eukprot:PhF_6_TR42747/c0_g1_i1/m.64622
MKVYDVTELSALGLLVPSTQGIVTACYWFTLSGSHAWPFSIPSQSNTMPVYCAMPFMTIRKHLCWLAGWMWLVVMMAPKRLGFMSCWVRGWVGTSGCTL